MPGAIAIILVGILALAVGALVGFNLRLRINQAQLATAERSAARILSEAQTKQKEILLEAKEEAIRTRAQIEIGTARKTQLSFSVPNNASPKKKRAWIARLRPWSVAQTPSPTRRRHWKPPDRSSRTFTRNK